MIGEDARLDKVMNRILKNQGLDNALNYEDGIEDVAEESFGSIKPTLQEQDEYGVIFTFTQGNGDEREIYFNTYDTGTMSARE